MIEEKSIPEDTLTVDMRQKLTTSVKISKATKLHKEKVFNQLIQYVSNDPKTMIMNLLCQKFTEKELGTQ